MEFLTDSGTIKQYFHERVPVFFAPHVHVLACRCVPLINKSNKAQSVTMYHQKVGKTKADN